MEVICKNGSYLNDVAILKVICYFLKNIKSMNVYITSTPEISNKKITQVVELLNKENGPLKFYFIDKLTKNDLAPHVDLDVDDSPIYFDSLNKVANKERDNFNFPKDDFYVILTSHKLDNAYFGKNWFSYFHSKNIFVRTYGWENHTPGKTQVAIAHQVIENIFQSISGHQYEKYERFHHTPKGCINDFCGNEYEIEMKLRTGHICKPCLDFAAQNGLSIELLGQISRFLNLFRQELLEIQSTIDELPVPKVRITEKGHVFVGDKEIDIKLINRALYIFAVLNRGEVLSINYLRSRFEEFRNIYFAIKKTGSDKAVKTFMGINVNSNGERIVVRELKQTNKYLSDVRNEIKTSFKMVLGNELAEILKLGLFVKEEYDHSSQSCFILPENPRLEFEIEQGFLEMIE